MNKKQPQRPRDAKGRPLADEPMKVMNESEQQAMYKRERDEKLAAARRAIQQTQRGQENEQKIVQPLLEALKKSGRSCEHCGACDIRIVGLCSSPVARGALSEWDGIIQNPSQFGCAVWRPRSEVKK